MIDFKILNVEDLNIVRPLVEAYIEEMGVGERTNPEYMLQNMLITVMSGKGHVMVDRAENPRSIAWFNVGKSTVFNESFYKCSLVYTGQEHRGSKELAMSMVHSIENAARFTGCKWVAGGCWKLGGKSSDNMWLKSGYVEQESYFTKIL